MTKKTLKELFAGKPAPLAIPRPTSPKTAEKEAKKAIPAKTKAPAKAVAKVALKTSKKEAPEATTEKPKEKIGSFIRTAILAGMSVKGVVEAVQKAYPGCKTGVNSVYFYRTELHKSGELKKA